MRTRACVSRASLLPVVKDCLQNSSLLPLVGATSSLLPECHRHKLGRLLAACCSLPSFLLWCCFPLSPLGGVVLSPPPSGWCCSCPFLLWEGVLFGGACSSSFFWVLVLYRRTFRVVMFSHRSLGGAATLAFPCWVVLLSSLLDFWWFPTKGSTFHQTFML